MTPRRPPIGLLVGVALLLLSASVLGQPRQKMRGPQPLFGGGAVLPPGEEPPSPSHRPVGRFPRGKLSPEEILSERLKSPRESKARLDELMMRSDVQELARKLMKDRKFLESLKGSLTREDAEKLLAQVRRGEGFGEDPRLQQILREGLGGKANQLSDEEKDLMKRWSEKLREQGVLEPPGNEAGGGPQGKASAPSAPVPPQPPPSGPDQASPPSLENLGSETPEWLRRRMVRWAQTLDRWADSPSGKSWRDALIDAAKRTSNRLGNNPVLMERARAWSRYLPRMSNFLPRPPTARLPTMPRLGGLPSVSSPPKLSLAQTGKGVVLVVLVGLVLLVLWRGRSLFEQIRTARANAWKLGPWPVRPEAVTTRGDVIRAFEHLALLCLGRGARSRHHHELANQIGSQPSLDGDRRREAAQTLAGFYEQARYAPESETMPEQDVERARRELCYLAGVSAA